MSLVAGFADGEWTFVLELQCVWFFFFFFFAQHRTDRAGRDAHRSEIVVHTVRAAGRHQANGPLYQSELHGKAAVLVLLWTQLLRWMAEIGLDFGCVSYAIIVL